MSRHILEAEALIADASAKLERESQHWVDVPPSLLRAIERLREAKMWLEDTPVRGLPPAEVKAVMDVLEHMRRWDQLAIVLGRSSSPCSGRQGAIPDGVAAVRSPEVVCGGGSAVRLAVCAPPRTSRVVLGARRARRAFLEAGDVMNNSDDPVRLEHVDGTANVRPRFVAEVGIDRNHSSVAIKMLSGSLYEVRVLTQIVAKPEGYPGTDEQWAQGCAEYNHWPNDEHPERGWLVTEEPRRQGPVTEDIETLEEAWERVSRFLHMWPFDDSANLEAT